MSIAFVCLGWILLFITPSAVVLSVWIGVRGCGWPILVSICQRYTASFAFKNNAPNSASAAKDYTAFMIVAFVMIPLLLGGSWSLFDRKKCPPALLLAFFSLQNPALLCMHKIILLAEYVIIASSCVAQQSSNCFIVSIVVCVSVACLVPIALSVGRIVGLTALA
jgi:hypothetical protein